MHPSNPDVPHRMRAWNPGIAPRSCRYAIDQLADPEDIARAMIEIHQAGKVRYFGVSNFKPSLFNAVQSAVRMSGAARVSVFCQENQVPNAPWYM